MKETRMESIHQGLDLFPFLNYDDLLTIHRITKFDDLVKSSISPPLAGGEEGEGDK
jgi:hypothetical protein